MPELPEVETVVRTLEYQIQDAVIQKVQVLYPKIVEHVAVDEFVSRLQSQRFVQFKRRGKYLLFELDKDVLVCHLRMEGKFYVEKDLSLVDKHTHIIFELADGRYVLYHDVRKFGRMYLYHKDEPLVALQKLGYEPWDTRLDVNYIKHKIRNGKEPLKAFLLDQSVICGIGNIYANEICYAVSLLPSTSVGMLSDEKWEQVIQETRRILQEAIACGGTTIRSYTSSLGVDGRFQISLMVHGRVNEPCKKCNATIQKVMLKGRGTYYCPRCQK